VLQIAGDFDSDEAKSFVALARFETCLETGTLAIGSEISYDHLEKDLLQFEHSTWYHSTPVPTSNTEVLK
jgi:hypothetical protein